VVSGDRVVFTTEVDSAGGPVPEVMMWTPASGLATVTPGEDANADPDVSGDRLAWLHNGAVVTWKVGEAAPTTLSPAADAPSGVHVSQDRVVWEASDAAGQRQVFTAALLPRLATVLRALGNSSVRLSRTYTLKGSIAPKAAPGRVSIVFKRYYRKAWRKVGATKYATLKSGAWSYKYRPASRGSWRAYVSFGGSTNATAVYQAAKTVYKPFRVY
jgi:hypothetical protein